MEPKRNKKIILITILITAVITGSIILAAMQFMNYNTDNSNQMKVASKSTDGTNDSGERKIIYWKAPMDPLEFYEEPGKIQH